MKNVCIVVRNKRDPYYGEEFGPAASALADGGFPADKIFLIDGADAHEFAQTVIECKNFFDNTFVLAADAELDTLRGKLCELVKCPPSAGVALEALGLYGYLVEFAGAGATVPISGFGYLLARGAMRGAERGLFGALTGALSAASAGVTAAIVFAFLFALVFKARSKKN